MTPYHPTVDMRCTAGGGGAGDGCGGSHEKTIAAVAPITPKKPAYTGQFEPWNNTIQQQHHVTALYKSNAI